MNPETLPINQGRLRKLEKECLQAVAVFVSDYVYKTYDDPKAVESRINLVKKYKALVQERRKFKK